MALIDVHNIFYGKYTVVSQKNRTSAYSILTRVLWIWWTILYVLNKLYLNYTHTKCQLYGSVCELIFNTTWNTITGSTINSTLKICSTVYFSTHKIIQLEWKLYCIHKRLVRCLCSFAPLDFFMISHLKDMVHNKR